MEEILFRLGVPDGWISAQFGLFGRLALAATIGGAIGLERELSGKPAGLRTNLLICLGAAILTEISMDIVSQGEAAVQDQAGRRGDPGRIAAQIVSGIGFLGAGAIIQSRGAVRGLTTAATIWVVAALGMAVGAREYVVALVSAAMVGLTLIVLGRVEDALDLRRGRRSYELILEPSTEVIRELERMMEEIGLKVRSSSVDKDREQFDAHYLLEGPRQAHEKVTGRLLSHPAIRKANRVAG